MPEDQPFIDYEKELEAAEQGSPTLSHSALKRFWSKETMRHHGCIGTWTVKYTTLLSRFMKEFDAEDIQQMMSYYIEISKVDKAIRFDVFYSERYQLYDTVIKGWKWN